VTPSPRVKKEMVVKILEPSSPLTQSFGLSGIARSPPLPARFFLRSGFCSDLRRRSVTHVEGPALGRQHLFRPSPFHRPFPLFPPFLPVFWSRPFPFDFTFSLSTLCLVKTRTLPSGCRRVTEPPVSSIWSPFVERAPSSTSIRTAVD